MKLASEKSLEPFPFQYWMLPLVEGTRVPMARSTLPSKSMGRATIDVTSPITSNERSCL